MRRSQSNWTGRRRNSNWLLRRSRSGRWRCSRSSGRRSHDRRSRRSNRLWRRRCNNRSGWSSRRRRNCRLFHHGLRYNGLRRRDRSRRNHGCGRRRRFRDLRYRRSNRRLCGDRRNWRTHRRRGRSGSFLLLRNSAQHIPGTRDVRQVDLGFDFFFAAQRTRGFRRGSLRIGLASNMSPDLVCFVVLDRTGMRLLLSHSDKRKRVENGLALDFQFSREIVNSNLTHPTFLFPALGLHRSLTESTWCTRNISNLLARAMVIQLFLERNLPVPARDFLRTQLPAAPRLLRRQLPRLLAERLRPRPRPRLLPRPAQFPTPGWRNNY